MHEDAWRSSYDAWKTTELPDPDDEPDEEDGDLPFEDDETFQRMMTTIPVMNPINRI
jgi:hypothetical protein